MTDAAGSAPVAADSPLRFEPIRKTLLWGFVKNVSGFLCTVFFELKVYGIYNIPRAGGALILSNHQSYLDPIVISVRLDRPMSYMAKAPLFKNKYFGWFIRGLNAFPVEQGAGDIGAVKESIARLQRGQMLNVFPEGSRTQDGEIAPLEKGVGLLLRRARVPVIPVVIDGSFEAWPKRRKFQRPHKIRVAIGPPMNELWKLDRDQIMAKIDTTLHQMFDDLQAGKIPPSPPRPRGR